MANGETPGIGGVPGTGPRKRAAPAFTSLLKAVVVDVPADLRRSARYRQLLLRPKK